MSRRPRQSFMDGQEEDSDYEQSSTDEATDEATRSPNLNPNLETCYEQSSADEATGSMSWNRNIQTSDDRPQSGSSDGFITDDENDSDDPIESHSAALLQIQHAIQIRRNRHRVNEDYYSHLFNLPQEFLSPNVKVEHCDFLDCHRSRSRIRREHTETTILRQNLAILRRSGTTDVSARLRRELLRQREATTSYVDIWTEQSTTSTSDTTITDLNLFRYDIVPSRRTRSISLKRAGSESSSTKNRAASIGVVTDRHNYPSTMLLSRDSSEENRPRLSGKQRRKEQLKKILRRNK